MAAVGGIVAACRANSVDPNTGGSNVLLYAVGAAVIGGTSLFGGKGRVLDAVLGGAVVAVIDNGMGLMGYSAGVKYVVTGVVLLARRRRRRAVPPARGSHRHPLTAPAAGSTSDARQARARRRSAGRTSARCCGTCTCTGRPPGPSSPPRSGSTAAPSARSPPTWPPPGWSARGRPGDRPGRTTVTGRPARVGPGLRVRVSASRWTGCAPPGSGWAAWSSTAARSDRPRGLRPREAAPLLAGAVKRDAAAGAAGRDLRRRRRRGLRHGPPRRRPGPARPHHRLGGRAARRGPRRRAGRSDVPITVGNVADLAALAEHARGVAAGCDNVIYLYGDVGVGAGIIAGGRRVTGHGGYGGEVGHMVVNPHGRPCELRLPRLLGDRDRRVRACCAPPAGRRPAAATRCWPSSTPPTAATRRPRRRSARSATGSASAWPTWSTSSTPRWSSSAARCATSTWPRRPRSAAGSTRSRCPPAASTSGCAPRTGRRTRALIGAAELAFERLLADPLDVG